jgi:hypothetical protein
MAGLKFTFGNGVLSPIHQCGQGQGAVKIGGELASDEFTRDTHVQQLKPAVTFVQWELFMHFNPLSLGIINFLPEADRIFSGVHCLEVAGKSPIARGHIIPIEPATIGLILPILEVDFIFGALAHVRTERLWQGPLPLEDVA